MNDFIKETDRYEIRNFDVVCETCDDFENAFNIMYDLYALPCDAKPGEFMIFDRETNTIVAYNKRVEDEK